LLIWIGHCRPPFLFPPFMLGETALCGGVLRADGGGP
jgi:hypothetical protein